MLLRGRFPLRFPPVSASREIYNIQPENPVRHLPNPPLATFLLLLLLLLLLLPPPKQAHPNKKLAERLHAERPDLYADDNHKPEMAVTLSDFEALCGFRPFQEIIWNLHFYPELRALVSLDAIHQVNTNIY